jgi:hypothetical protein
LPEESQQIKMFRSLTAVGPLAVLGISLIALPALKVEASETLALVKGDWLQVRSPVYVLDVPLSSLTAKGESQAMGSAK